MTLLLSADIHLSDSPKDEHRWGLFPWLAQQADAHKCEAVILCGDITDAKDRHPSTLVNRLVKAVRELATHAHVFILKGNHDYFSEEHPFFAFLHDRPNGVTFVNKPRLANMRTGVCWFLPSTKDHEKEWDGLDFSKSDYIFAHQTFNGARAENGTLLKGIPPSYFGGYKGCIYSGDIHVPQVVSQKPRIEYIGSPYRVHFGDKFTPRCLLVADGVQKNLRFPTKGKHLLWVNTVAGLEEYACTQEVVKGDQVKIRVTVPRADLPKWQETKRQIKAYAERQGWELFGVEMATEQSKGAAVLVDKTAVRNPQEIVRNYAKANKVGKPLLECGMFLLAEAQA